MKFNKQRREGLSKMLSTIASASVVGLILGFVVESSIGPVEAAQLFVIAVVFGAFSLILLPEDESDEESSDS